MGLHHLKYAKLDVLLGFPMMLYLFMAETLHADLSKLRKPWHCSTFIWLEKLRIVTTQFRQLPTVVYCLDVYV